MRPRIPSLAQSFLFAALALSGVLVMRPLAASAQEAAQKPPLTRMLFVFDASNSMNAFWGNQPKINTARELLLKSLKQLEGQPDLELALRLYGHQTAIHPGKQDCDDTKLEVPFSGSSIEPMRQKLLATRCLGTTPIARSLEKAAGDFPPTTFNDTRKVRNVIILITDGIEACDEDPCAVSRALQAKGIVLKPFVIGVGLTENDRYSLQCVGNYFDASTPELFEHVLKVVVTQALNSTTAQISLMTTDAKPTETDVAVTLYDQKTGQVRYHLEHTMNQHGTPDTLSLDPIFTYRVVAHTVPPSVRENVAVKPGVHTNIAVDAGMGSLSVKMGTGPPDAGTVSCIVRRSGEMNTLLAQDMGTTQRYRVGTYDLEVLTLPRTLIPNVRVEQGRNTDIVVPRPGVLNVLPSVPGPGAIFLKQGDELVWVADLDPGAARGQYRLQPGSYQVIYRSQYAREIEYGITKDVAVESGRAVTLNF
ncbi:MAG: VWA domain-containing protein [Flavobacteriales bacterium]|nr:VWA domain-containing protein [Flavobacteriales bacterium]